MLHRMLKVCAVAVTVIALSAPGQAAHYEWLTKNDTIQELLYWHNAERARYGMAPLALNAEMCLHAQQHATYMATNGAFQHSGLPWRENIYMGPMTAQAATQGWITSPAHHANLLSGYEVGFGYMVVNGRTAWVGVFR